jgi:hypothetical protein
VAHRYRFNQKPHHSRFPHFTRAPSARDFALSQTLLVSPEELLRLEARICILVRVDGLDQVALRAAGLGRLRVQPDCSSDGL